MTNFEKVCDFNISFGLPHFDVPQTNIFIDNQKLVDLRVNLCVEEVQELSDAFNDKNFTEVIDALSDELYVLYGAASSFGENLDSLFRQYVKENHNNIEATENESNLNLLKRALESNPLDKQYINNEMQHDLFDKDKIPTNIVTLHSFIKDYIEQLKKSNNEKNYKLMIELLVCLLYHIYKLGIQLGIDLDRSFDIVHNSNMSKLCLTQQNAIDTVEWYKKNDTRYDTPNYRKSDNDKYWVVFNESTGKILKFKDYKPANFTSMFV